MNAFSVQRCVYTFDSTIRRWLPFANAVPILMNWFRCDRSRKKNVLLIFTSSSISWMLMRWWDQSRESGFRFFLNFFFFIYSISFYSFSSHGSKTKIIILITDVQRAKWYWDLLESLCYYCDVRIVAKIARTTRIKIQTMRTFTLCPFNFFFSSDIFSHPNFRCFEIPIGVDSTRIMIS